MSSRLLSPLPATQLPTLPLASFLDRLVRFPSLHSTHLTNWATPHTVSLILSLFPVFIFLFFLPHLSLFSATPSVYGSVHLCPLEGACPLFFCSMDWLAVSCWLLEVISNPSEKQFLILNGSGEASAHRKWQLHFERRQTLLVTKAKQTRTAVYVWKDLEPRHTLCSSSQDQPALVSRAGISACQMSPFRAKIQ